MVHSIEMFGAGTIAGAVVIALYYRRVAIKLGELKRELEVKAKKL